MSHLNLWIKTNTVSYHYSIHFRNNKLLYINSNTTHRKLILKSIRTFYQSSYTENNIGSSIFMEWSTLIQIKSFSMSPEQSLAFSDEMSWWRVTGRTHNIQSSRSLSRWLTIIDRLVFNYIYLKKNGMLYNIIPWPWWYSWWMWLDQTYKAEARIELLSPSKAAYCTLPLFRKRMQRDNNNL